MAIIRFLMNIVSTCWNIISGIKIDGVSWTSIIISFIIVFFVVGSFLRPGR